MSWASKTWKKAKKSVKKHLGNKWWIPGYGTAGMLGLAYKGMYDEYKKNEGAYNRMAAIVAGSILTGGLVGAGAGAMGAGASFASGAASGAATGAIAGGTSAFQEIKTNQALQEQEEEANKIAQEQAAEQERLAKLAALRERGGMPEDTLNILYTNNSAITSQHKRNQKSRQTAGKTLGAGNSTLA